MNEARDDYQSLIISADPVGYWPLREDANDKSGHGHHGQNLGTLEFVQDETGGWVKLDGSSYIEVPSNPTYSQPTCKMGLTVEVWMQAHSLHYSKPYIHWLGKGEPGNVFIERLL